jgi:type IV pilus assembly protein PilX
MNSSPLNAASRAPFARLRIAKQRGVALFFALICMVAIMLAAVALIRSVDTAALISGNLAFQQSATSSGDGGTEAAITWLAGIEAANSTMNVLIDDNHPFNANNAAMGYFASLDPTKSLTASTGSHFNWDNNDSRLLAQDSSGNTTRYIIQRMCRTAGIKVKDAGCLFSGAAQDNNKQNILLPQEICKGDGCPVAGQTPMLRITSRTTGPKNTLSYVQAFVY